VKTSDIHRGALPFMGLQALGLVIVMLVPATVTWLVQQVGL
jgi:TRAP-type mannitol/chloroaromatic compound transport system permease large subunit